MLSFGNTILTTGSGAWLEPPNPNTLNLPPFTIRVQYAPGKTPVNPPNHGATVTQVSVDPNIWDVTRALDEYGLPYWDWLLGEELDLVAVLGANSSGITSMHALFQNCKNLQSVEFFDTSLCTDMSNMFSTCSSLEHAPLYSTASCLNMHGMFQGCASLKNVPLYSTASCTDMSHMFAYCGNVEGGALALYTQAASQAVPPIYHGAAFFQCGEDTVSGRQELEQIPYDWRNWVEP